MNAADLITPREVQRITGMSHAAVLTALGNGTLEGTSINGKILVSALSVARLSQYLNRKSAGATQNAVAAK